MPRDAYRHAVVALTEVDRLSPADPRADVPVHRAAQAAGPRRLALSAAVPPDARAGARRSCTRRNLAALEAVVPAWAAGVPVRIHGEHGRDVDDLRRRAAASTNGCGALYRPFVSHYVALVARSDATTSSHKVGVAAARVTQIYNGVDTARFRPADGAPAAIDGLSVRRPAPLARRHRRPHAGGQGSSSPWRARSSWRSQRAAGAARAAAAA